MRYFFRIKEKTKSKESNLSVILIEKAKFTKIANYHFDITLLKKDFPVFEIDKDFHFIYSKDIEKFFKNNSEEKINLIPERLMVLNDAVNSID